jgi:hypothetical protein
MFNDNIASEHARREANIPETQKSKAPRRRTVQDVFTAKSGEQKQLTKNIHQLRYNQVKAHLDSRKRTAYFTSLQEEGAATLYTTLPASSRLRLPSEHMRIAICLRLSIDTMTAHRLNQFCPTCGRHISHIQHVTDLAWDYHIETCAEDGFHGRRHNAVQSAIQLLANRIGHRTELAKKVRDSQEDSPGLITDLYFPNLPSDFGKTGIAIDLSICHPLALGPYVSVNTPANTPLAKVTAVEEAKVAKYKASCDARKIGFMPVGIETTGALGRSAKSFFTILLRNGCVLSEETFETSSRIKQEVAIALAIAGGEKFVYIHDKLNGTKPAFLQHKAAYSKNIGDPLNSNCFVD